VVFGPSVIRWADARFAHRFAGGPQPAKVRRRGPERVRYEWHEFGKAVLAGAITSGLLGLGVLMVGDAERSRALVGFELHLGVVLAFWLVLGPVWVMGSRSSR
jgi:hypothetical protein